MKIRKYFANFPVLSSCKEEPANAHKRGRTH